MSKLEWGTPEADYFIGQFNAEAISVRNYRVLGGLALSYHAQIDALRLVYSATAHYALNSGVAIQSTQSWSAAYAEVERAELPLMPVRHRLADESVQLLGIVKMYPETGIELKNSEVIIGSVYDNIRRCNEKVYKPARGFSKRHVKGVYELLDKLSDQGLTVRQV